MNEKTTTVNYLYKLKQCTCKIVKQKLSKHTYICETFKCPSKQNKLMSFIEE